MDSYHHGNLRATLLKAASQLIGKVGSEALTLREVARRAGVSHNAPYRHFKNKQDLLAALATDAFRQLNETLRGCIGDTGENPVERLRKAARAYLHFGLANRARFQAMFHSTFDPRSYPEYVANYTASFDILSELLEDCLPSRDPLPETYGELVWASIHGITELGIAQRLEFGQRDKLEALSNAAIDTLVRGLKHA